MPFTGDDLMVAGVSPSTRSDRGRPWASWRALARALEPQVEEIRADPVLWIYGAALALLNVLTVQYWRASGERTVMCFDRTPTVALLERIRLHSPAVAEEWAQPLLVARRNGIGAKWVDIARRKAARYRRRTAVREAAGRLARATLPADVRRLVRRAVWP